MMNKMKRNFKKMTSRKSLGYFMSNWLVIFFTLIGLDHIFPFAIAKGSLYFIIAMTLISAILSFLLLVILVVRVNIRYKYEENNLNLKIVRGNILKQEKGIIVIPVDTNYKNYDYENNHPIPTGTLQSIFMANTYSSKNEIEIQIEYDRYKSDKSDFLLFKIGELDDKFRFYLKSIGSYIDIIYKLCGVINDVERDDEFYIPVIGNRFRLKNNNNYFNGQLRLTLLITAMKMYKFESKVKITIVVYTGTEEDYDFGEL